MSATSGQTGRIQRALVPSGVAAALYSRDGDQLARPRVAVAFGLYLAAVVIAFAVDEPPNEKLRDAGDPDSILSCGRDLQWCRTHNTATGRNIDSTRDEIEEA